MPFVATTKLGPDEVLDLLRRGLHGERGDSFARVQVLSSSTIEAYGQIDGNAFQVSRHAGMQPFGAVAIGSVAAAREGSIVQVTIHFGAAPPSFPFILVIASLLAAAVGVLRSDGALEVIALWSFLASGAALYFWHTRSEIRFLLDIIGKAAGGLSFREPGA